MIKRIIEERRVKKQEKLRNKPTYKLDDLYVGEIVIYKQVKNVGLGKRNHYYDIIKKVGILSYVGYEQYHHIKSGQDLYELGEYKSIVGDYAVNNLRKFEKACPIYMRKNNFTPSTKVSLAFIEEFEDIINQQIAPDLEVDELFK